MESVRMIRRKIIKGDIEKKIATAGIVSTEFCRDVTKIYKPEYIQVDYIRQVLDWVFEYFDEYKKAPERQIQDMFIVEKDEMKQEQAELIETFLSRISKEHEEKETFNHQYAYDQAEKYFRKRSLQLLFERGLGMLIKNKVDEAESSISTYGKVSKMVGNWVDPLDPEIVNIFMGKEKDSVFRFSGIVGDLVGDLERTWLVGFMAPMKRGKSWCLQETAIQALSCKLNVMFISLEMSLDMMKERLYKRIAGYSGSKEKLTFPIFDCLLNQDGSCNKSIRVNDTNILIKDSKKGEVLQYFDPKIKYGPCTECRGRKDYEVAVWWMLSNEMNVNRKQIEDKIRRFSKMYGKRLKLVSYPAFTASIDDIERELDNLEYLDGFVPDVILIDYADILAVTDKQLSERGRIDDVWKRLKGMSAVRHCLVFTASQSTRKSIKKRSLSQEDTAEEIRKLAHVDVMVGINQTNEEKKRGEGRLGIIAHRHQYFDNRQVKILQQLEVGIPFLDSEWN
ncbi:hypothetical protein LCGC14_1990460 [marine sediment metagenome]|uniref:SF4 helicase domain-containing protein n=1 Tax=marine sediment metagenome TaxID=412755 RepID=A0A0F9HJL1_9ZZZZ